MFDSSSPGLDLRAALHPFHSALCCCRLRPTDRFPQGTGPFTCGDSTCSHASNQGSCYCIEWCTDACGALTHIRSPKRRTSSDHWNAIIGDVEPCLCCAFFPTGCFGILLLRINNGLMPHLHASSESGRWETRPGLPCKLFANLMFFLTSLLQNCCRSYVECTDCFATLRGIKWQCILPIQHYCSHGSDRLAGTWGCHCEKGLEASS